MVLCIDIGGTSIKYSVIEEKGQGINIIYKNEFPTLAKQICGNGIKDKIIQLTKEIRKHYTIEGVAISTAGVVNSTSGEIIYANENIPGYIGINLKKEIETIFNLPCIVENDVNCAALGEYAYGAGQGYLDLLCITVGTGVGGAIVIGGEVFTGHSGSAGEIGYMLIGSSTLEETASTTAMINRVYDRSGEKTNGKIIFEKAQNGNKICKEEIYNMCDSLCRGIANCIYLLNPQIIILGGGIMAREDYLKPILEECLKKYVNCEILKNTKLSFAKLSNDAGMAGAFYKFHYCKI